MNDHTLVVLGTSSQVPTRERNHNGYFLKWGREGILVDPGEGTQRQMSRFGISVSRVTAILVTHFHGDHCLGLPGIVQRLGLNRVKREVHVVFPASGKPVLDSLLQSCLYKSEVKLREVPVAQPMTINCGSDLRLEARCLQHSVETYGYRVHEQDSRTMLPDRLRAAGLSGRLVGELKEQGRVTVQGVTYGVDEFSRITPGRSVSFVLDTRPCTGAAELARDADLLLCESTYLEAESRQAEAYGHMTAGQAARLARDNGAGHLLLSHFSPRYRDLEQFRIEAEAIHDPVSVTRDGTEISLPKKQRRLD